MGYVNITRHLEVTPEAAFTYVARTDRLAQWLTLLTDVHAVADRLDHVGAKLDARLKVGGRSLDTTWEVTKAEAPRIIRLVGSSDDGGATAWLSFGAWEGGCEMQFEMDYELPGGFITHATDSLFLERSVSRELKHSMANLKVILEEHPEVH